ncbi:MAG: LysR family transcriptional regulator, partial [Pseudomonadota bacterium]|nr:LysR family transcriptional regulator [Pseudomonadota bacterium]
MIENLETLVTLSKTGTMMEAATVLKISQSAVSKRVAALERQYDRALIERRGRRVVLTAYGTRLVEKVTPLITELRSVFIEEPTLQRGKIILGVSEAILASWAPALFARVRERLPEVEFEFHAQRSPVVLDRIRSGEYMVGLCTGSAEADYDLVSEVL